MAIHRYLEHLEGDGKSPLTVKKYDASLRLFESLSGVSDPLQINKAIARSYKSRLARYRTHHGKPFSVRTRNAHVSTLRQFLRYCLIEEDQDVLPPDRISRLKEEERQPKWLTGEDLRRLLEMPDLSTQRGKRDSAILELFFSTGLRLHELVSLNQTDLNLATREIAVRGKGGKVRVVFLSDRAVSALQRYLDCRLDYLVPLFIGRHRQANLAMPSGESFRLGDRWIQKLLKKYSSLAGIISSTTPHTLRHTFATDLIRGGCDLRSVQLMLGHKDIRTTQVYTHLTSPQLKEIHGRCHGEPQ